MTALLAQDQKWVDFHLQLAKCNPDIDIAEFSQFFLPSEEQEPEVDVSDDDLYDHRDDSLMQERDEFLRHCRQASHKDYQRWLRGYLRKGGKVTHPRHRKFNGCNWYIVTQDVYLPELYGANSLNIIVPEDVELYGSHSSYIRRGSGHNSVFFMRDFTHFSNHIESFTN